MKEEPNSVGYQLYVLSILLSAITNGVFLILKSYRDSSVCCSIPCIKSITKIAKSQREDPLVLKLAKLSCPGVSITNKPGALTSTG